MPRKSRELRLQQAVDLSSAYDKAGVVTNSARFINDMIFKLERKKNLSSKQKSYLDSLIEQGVPEPKDLILYSRIMDAANIERLPEAIRTKLIDPFAKIAFNGWKISPAQQKWLDSLLEKAHAFKENGPWSPDSSLMEKIKFASDIAQTRNYNYWANRPGENKAAAKVAAWLVTPEQFDIEEWHIEKLLHSSRVAVREFDNPSFLPGEIRGFRNSTALILTGPHAGDSTRYNGKPVYEILHDGEAKYVIFDDIKKRIKK